MILITTTATFCQQLAYKKSCIFNSKNEKLATKEVRELLAPHPELLSEYNSGITKTNVGGFLLGFGLGAIVGDLLVGATQDIEYPTVFTYLGIASAVISIPVLSGRSKKIKSAIEGYNQSLQGKKSTFTIEKINILTNQNGIGLRASF